MTESRFVSRCSNSREGTEIMDTLKDKVVLITGAGKGSGRLLAQAFAGREPLREASV